jgi:hypothetical protein
MWLRRISFLMLVLLLGGCAASVRSDSGEAKAAPEDASFLTVDEWPRTCDEAVSWVVNHLDAESTEIVRNTPRDELIKFHHGWGTGIRNNFGLWRGNRELLESCLALEPGTQYHPDSVSMIIIERTWDRLHSQ